ncbi:PWWP domain-containing protein 2A [Pseudochaenichthys georgianus]|uniref:PWWP domain-containing protein 2A n=1 Tax=Pseudochaenichthys georgianus TaxID=52239 RepID=UPI0039C1ED6B
MAAVAAEPGAARREEEEPGPDLPREPGRGLTGEPGEPGLTTLLAPGPQLEPWMEAGGQRVGPEAGRGEGEGERPGADREDRLCSVPGDPQGGGSEPRAVFLLSFPAPPPGTEAGLALTEPAEPTTNETGTDRAEPADRDQDRDGDQDLDRDYTLRAPVKQEPHSAGLSPADLIVAGLSPADLSPADLSPGSEVRVSLDHVIDDALVVSFRRGEQVFSGVLMDVSRRFGPYGIPITVLPRRDDRVSRPLMISLPEVEASTKQEEVSPPPPPRSKLPPLFQEGAPYPPPLFLRDTYNQALPQPLLRKIRRPKRRYRCEEPTSIMNAIKLRPRQVLCDKCKGVVGGGRESRRGPVELKEEASRRRRAAEGPVSAEVKRLRGDDRRPPNDRRPPSGIHVSSSALPTSSRVLRGGASGRLCLNSKKAPPSRGPAADVSKARQNLKKEQDQDQEQPCRKAVTRASSLQNQRVHFTRRLQSTPPSLPPRMRLKPQRYRTDDQVPPPSQNQPPPSPPKLSSRSPPPQTHYKPCPHDSPSLQHSSSPGAPALANETLADGEDEGGDLKRRCKSSMSPPPVEGEEEEGEMKSRHKSSTSPPPVEGEEEEGEMKRRRKSSPPPPVEGEEEEGVSRPPPPPVEGEEEEGEMKRRRKSSTSSSSSSSSSSPPVFSKPVSKVLLPDGRSLCLGDIVWAKISGFPWWPARVLSITVSRRSDTGLAVRQEARVSWFGSPTTSFLPLTQLSPFLESFQCRFDRKRKGPYRRAIAEAASAAKQLTPEVRALLTQFET